MERKSNKGLLIVLIVIVALVCGAGGWFLGGYVADREDKVNNSNNKVEDKTDTKVENKETETTNDNNQEYDDGENISSYIGIWQYFSSNNLDIPEAELDIKKVDNNIITFDLDYYRLTGFENVSVSLTEGEGTFTAKDINGWEISGTIILKDNTVSLNITNSTSELFRPRNTVFKIKSNESILK